MTLKLQLIVKATRIPDGNVIVEPLYLGLSAGDAQAAWNLARSTLEGCELRWYKNPDPVYIRKAVRPIQPESADPLVSLGEAPAVLPDGGAPGDSPSPDEASAGGADGGTPRKRRAAADA